MLFRLKNLAFFAGVLALFAGAAMAQTSGVEGFVKAADGTPLKGAVVKFDRTDIKGHYEVKTDKKGHYGHYGLPLGLYNISLEVDGKVVDSINKVKTSPGDPMQQNFDMKKSEESNKALAQAAETGTLSKEQERSMSADQKAALDKSLKAREAALQKNKALSDAFNAGKAAMDAKNYDDAITNFNKAAEMDPTQVVIFSQLAGAYEADAVAKPTEATDLRNKEFDTWKKVIALDPNQAAYYNNYALALGKAKNYPEMQANIEKAAQLDPAGAGKYYYNLGAILTNSGQTDQACANFKKSTDLDPAYADAHYQYGICEMGKAQVDPKSGKFIAPPGTAEAFQKYLELKPTGPNADSAKAMLAQMEGVVDTKYTNPEPDKKKKK